MRMSDNWATIAEEEEELGERVAYAECKARGVRVVLHRYPTRAQASVRDDFFRRHYRCRVVEVPVVTS
jgi:hypothetical protein